MASVSAKSVGFQLLISFLLAKSFSSLNSYMKSLQLIVYCSLLLELCYPERVKFTVKIMLKVCQLDIMPDQLVDWVFTKVLRLEFKEDNDPPEKF